MQDKLIAFRVDAGTRIGFGHLSRCISLAHSFKKLGIMSHFITNKDDAIRNILQNEGFANIAIEGDEMLLVKKFLAENRPDVVIVDTKRGLSVRYSNLLKDNGRTFVLVDNQKDICRRADLLVLPGFEEQFKFYRNKVHDNAKVLVGGQYVILNKYFPVKVERPEKRKSLYILISMGGADKFNITQKVIESLSKIKHDFVCSVVLGKFNMHIPEYDDRFVILRDVENLPHLMVSSDIGIVSMGITAYEAAAAGLPSILISHSYENLDAAMLLQKKGLSLSFGHRSEINRRNMAHFISSFIHNNESRKQMSKTGKELIDGLGSQRTASYIASHFLGD